MTRSTNATNWTSSSFEKFRLPASHLTESNRRPSPYHGHASPPWLHCLHRSQTGMLRKHRTHPVCTAPGPRLVPRPASRIRPSHHAAIVALVVALVAPILVGIWQGENSSNAAGWFGGVFVFFALVAYMLVNLANIVFHLRNARSQFNWFMNGFIPAAGIAIDGYILY